MTKTSSSVPNLKSHITKLTSSLQLTLRQLEDYSDNGFLLIENVFTTEEIDILLQTIDNSISEQKSGFRSIEGGFVLEENQNAIRTLNGLHFEYEIFSKLCCHPRLLLLAQQISSDDNLYVYQFKINLKEAFAGEVWEWHQDYIYWLKGDGMPEPKAITVMIFLDNITEVNAPLMLIPGSHKQGVVDVPPRQEDNIAHKPEWMSFVSSKLKYTAPRELISKLVKENGLVTAKAPLGSILFFDANIFHASSNNLSPFPRRTILITYNPIVNVNNSFNDRRPNFLCSRDLIPLSITTDDILKCF